MAVVEALHGGDKAIGVVAADDIEMVANHRYRVVVARLAERRQASPLTHLQPREGG